jgi:hypothetical protein
VLLTTQRIADYVIAKVVCVALATILPFAPQASLSVCEDLTENFRNGMPGVSNKATDVAHQAVTDVEVGGLGRENVW